jgi:hypothetical protein
MQRDKILLCAAVVTVGSGAPAWAQDDTQQLREEVEALRQEVRELRGENEQSWIERREREEIRELIDEAMADAEQRQAISGSGLQAGHDGGFFLSNADNTFRLELAGHLQVRYVHNRRQDSAGDDNLGGFALRRLKFKPSGHVTYGDQQINFFASLAGADEQTDDAIFEDYGLNTEIFENVSLQTGRWKQPFALQNMRSSSRQLAVERSAVHETFTVDRSEGVMLSYGGDRLKLYGSVNDGREAEKTRFEENNVDFAFTGRGEYLVAGEWDQMKDASSWSGDGPAAMVGAATHYEIGETGTPGTNDSFLLWTGDVSVQAGGFGSLLALYGHHADNEAANNYDDYGALAEAGYMVVPDTIEPFARYELIMQDDSRPGVAAGNSNEQTQLVTAGVNWYHHRHDSKFTLDVVYALDPLNAPVAGPDADEVSSGSLGLRQDAAGEDGQLAVRAQYQLKW